MSREGKHVLSHAAIYLIARGVPGVIAFVALPLFTRLLAPAEYGRYALVVATVELINALLFQWLRLSLVRYLPVYRDDPTRLKSTLASTNLLLVLALAPLATAAWFAPLPDEWRQVVFPIWLLLAVQAAFELCCEYSRASLRPWQYMVLQVMRSVANVFVGALLVRMHFGWWGPFVGVGVGMAAGVALAAYRDWRDVRFLVDRDALGKICQYGIPLSVTVGLAIVVGSSDRFLINHFLGEQSTGLYSVAVDFTARTLTMLLMVINMAVYPIAVRAFEHEGKEAAQKQMSANASLLMAIGLPCVVGLTILARGVSHCFLGEEYRSATVSIMPLIAIGTFLAGFKAYHFDAAFQFAHRTIHQVWIVLIVAIVNVVLNVIAIPHWGINGSAGASVLAYLISIAMTAAIGRRHFVLPFPVKACLQVTAACAAMGAVIWPFRASVGTPALAAQIIGGGAVYAGVLLAFNFLDLRDAILRRIFTRRSARGFELVPPPVKIAGPVAESI